MENTFNLKAFLSEIKLLKEEPSFQYPQEILDMDTEIADLKAKLQAAITAKNKAKSNYTKSVPSLSDQGEFAGIGLSKDKRNQYTFKDLVDVIKEISKESGNDWEALTGMLKSKYGDNLQTYTTGPYPSLYVVSFFTIYLVEDGGKESTLPSTRFIKIGNWWVRPW
tara:strand:- start:787 stop:1284 length:498 start_codon:yes stop_codon:yes gene_type:complete